MLGNRLYGGKRGLALCVPVILEFYFDLVSGVSLEPLPLSVWPVKIYWCLERTVCLVMLACQNPEEKLEEFKVFLFYWLFFG